MPEWPSTENPRQGQVLFVDDDADVVKAAALMLSRHGMAVIGAADPLQARSVMAAEPVDVILLDLNFTRGATSGEEGLRLLQQLLVDDPQAVVVVVTAHSGINVAVRAMQAGASDFVIKPWNNARLLATVQDALQLRRRRVRPADPGDPPPEPEPMLLGESPAIERVRSLIARAAPTDAPVLVLGEAGVGKSLVARRLHLASRRTEGAYLALDLSVMTGDAAERALFGDDLGAPGALVDAAAGTLVLEEVAELSPALQGRLLAALGSRSPRMISTSRRPRGALQGRGGLRDELLYRLNTVEIVLPPLAARGDDALLLAEHFLDQFARRYDRAPRPLSLAAVAAIRAGAWPGGVRTLRQAAERAVIFADGAAYEATDLGLKAAVAEEAPNPLNLERSERALITAALKRHGFNVSHAARELGLTRQALYRRMGKHGL